MLSMVREIVAIDMRSERALVVSTKHNLNNVRS